MIATPHAPLLTVVQQHVEEAASLRATREFLVQAPQVRLHALRRHDDRSAAHLDGVAVAGAAGAALCTAALESPGIGEVFAATVLAIEGRDAEAMARVLALAETGEGAGAAAKAGLLSAFGWVSAPSLRGISRELLGSRGAFQRSVGLAACGMHQVDAGRALAAALHDSDLALRERAARVAGDLGRVDLLPACLQLLEDAQPRAGQPALPAAFHAARAALLLGERDDSVACLHRLAGAPGPRRLDAIRLLLKVLAPRDTRVFLQTLALNPADVRELIAGIGAAGDAHYVPWLIQQMSDPKRARMAGEAFSMLTGLDLAAQGLEAAPPEEAVPGPSEDPADTDVAMDEDEGLPWPDPAKLAAWWKAQGGRFATGTRSFMGEAPNPANCVSALQGGFQRQRIAAALHLRLIEPGRPLFNTAAPAWRQQRLLANAAA